MIVKKLLKNVDIIKTVGDIETDILGLTINSKSVNFGDMFFCIKGDNFDGHNYITEAVQKGAKAVVCEKELNVNILQIIVKDVRIALSIIAANYYNNPADKMKIIGVVGTNGKTTTSLVINDILEYAGIKCGVIGTLGAKCSNFTDNTLLTTPDSIELQRLLNKMQKSGVKVVVMEVSAHAIYYKKTYGIKFDIGVFTNLSQDHLDFFKDMENYGNVKKSFFTNQIQYAVVNADDSLGKEIINTHKRCLTYGIVNPCDVFVIDIKSAKIGSNFVMNLFDKVYNIKTKLTGTFNVYNIMAAATACSVFGIKTNVIADAIEKIKPINGRLNPVCEKNGAIIYVDYAHTPDGLEKVLYTLKSITNGKIILVFGCGGNRDKTKRNIMGKIAAMLSDFTVITSDNPRYEEPISIMKQIEDGYVLVSKNYILIEDRKEAIKYAISHLSENDVLLIAGKGAEEYQEILGVKHDFSDKQVVLDLVNNL